MLFHKTTYPVINPAFNCFEIMKDNKIYRINHKHKNFEKKIEQFVDMKLLDWEDVSKQTFFTWYISEEFMRKHVDDLEWWSVLTGRFQKGISESFLREISNYLDWNWVIHNNKSLSKNMVREFANNLIVLIKEGEKFNLENWINENLFVTDDEMIG